jgi:hypothetical protein
MLREAPHHCEFKRKHANHAGFAQVEAEFLSFNCMDTERHGYFFLNGRFSSAFLGHGTTRT